MFVATANNIETIPPALRDRMEIINLSGYTEYDKIVIARKHLINRQMEENGITKDTIEFTDDGLQTIVANYTRESGLRNFEREIGGVCRKIAKDVVTGDKSKKIVTPELVATLLGPARYIRDEEMGEARIGMSTGLAWTSVGGEVLFIEAVKMKGKGAVVMTGQLGDVMQESVKAAMSYARAHAKELGNQREGVRGV